MRQIPGEGSLVRVASLGLGNQAISSLTNFAFNLYLLRTLPAEGYGYYHIAFAITLFVGNLGQSFLFLQMVVDSPGYSDREREEFSGRILTVTLIAGGGLLILSALAVLVLHSVSDHQIGGAGVAVSFMAVTFTLKEFFIRHAFNEERPGDAVLVHGVLGFVLFAAILAVELGGLNVTTARALLVYGVAHATASLVGKVRSGLSLRGHDLGTIRDDLARLGGDGAWAAATTVVYFVRMQAHTIVVAGLLGPLGIAQLNAARVLVTPATLMIPALSQVALPRLAKIRERGRSSVVAATRLIGRGLLGVALLYGLALLATWDVLAVRILGAEYADLIWVAGLWCLYACTLAVRNSLEWSLQALRAFKDNALVNLFGAVLALGSVFFLTYFFELPGAVMGLVLAEYGVVLLLRGVVGAEAAFLSQRSEGIG